MKSTSEIHLSISDQWNPPISDKWNPPDYQWNPPVNPPVYQWNPPISQIHLSVKSTYQWNPPISQVYQWNPPISQIYLSVKSTCLSVKSTCLSVRSTYQSNPPISQITYQSNPPISQICLSKSACPPFASAAVTRKPPNGTGPAARNPATGTGCFFHQSNYQLLHTQRRGFKSPSHSCFYTQRGLLNGTQLTDGTGNTRPGSAHSLRQISHNFKEHKNSLKNELVQGFYASNTAPWVHQITSDQDQGLLRGQSDEKNTLKLADEKLWFTLNFFKWSCKSRADRLISNPAERAIG